MRTQPANPPENKTARTHFESGLHCPKNPDPGKPAFCRGSILVLTGLWRPCRPLSPDRPVSVSALKAEIIVHLPCYKKQRRCRKLIPQRLCFYVCYYTRFTWKVKRYCIQLYIIRNSFFVPFNKNDENSKSPLRKTSADCPF